MRDVVTRRDDAIRPRRQLATHVLKPLLAHGGEGVVRELEQHVRRLAVRRHEAVEGVVQQRAQALVHRVAFWVGGVSLAEAPRLDGCPHHRAAAARAGRGRAGAGGLAAAVLEAVEREHLGGVVAAAGGGAQARGVLRLEPAAELPRVRVLAVLARMRRQRGWRRRKDVGRGEDPRGCDGRPRGVGSDADHGASGAVEPVHDGCHHRGLPGPETAVSSC